MTRYNDIHPNYDRCILINDIPPPSIVSSPGLLCQYNTNSMTNLIGHDMNISNYYILFVVNLSPNIRSQFVVEIQNTLRQSLTDLVLIQVKCVTEDTIML